MSRWFAGTIETSRKVFGRSRKPLKIVLISRNLGPADAWQPVYGTGSAQDCRRARQLLVLFGGRNGASRPPNCLRVVLRPVRRAVVSFARIRTLRFSPVGLQTSPRLRLASPPALTTPECLVRGGPCVDRLPGFPRFVNRSYAMRRGTCNDLNEGKLPCAVYAAPISPLPRHLP